MIEFMVIAFPRSGTTWVSNWLTTDTTLCHHDPLAEFTLDELDRIESHKTLGISCTGIMLYGDELNSHYARKVILHREEEEVNKSLRKIGLTDMPSGGEEVLNGINGRHYHWKEVFDNPKEIYEFLLQKEFDKERHENLVKIQVNPMFDRLPVRKEAVTEFVGRMRNALWQS